MGYVRRRPVTCETCGNCKESQQARFCKKCAAERRRDRKRYYIERYVSGKQAEASARYFAKPEKRVRQQLYSRGKQGLPPPTRPSPATCELCGEPERRVTNGRRHSLALDHCHETGIFRGWLCFKCNCALGKFGDSLAGLRRAVAYLEKAYGETT